MIPVALAAGVLLFSGLAIAYVIGGAAVPAFLATDNARYPAILPQQIFPKIDVFALILVHLLAGLMIRATEQLPDQSAPDPGG